ncbi:hypothetical protein [Mesorhizobium tianshanense]|nr:hypothetical protein [Mesorhizobium tianshanense]
MRLSPSRVRDDVCWAWIRSEILDLKWGLGALERAAFAARLVGLMLELTP